MHTKQHKAPWGRRGVRGVSGIQPTLPPHDTGQSPVKPGECVRDWGSVHQGGLRGGAVTSPEFLPSVRCSPLKELVEVFVHFKAKSEEKLLWTLEVRLCKIYGAKNFGQQMNSVDHVAACRNMSPT